MTLPGLRGWRSGGLKLFRDLAALASGQIVGKIVGFVAFAYLARVLEPEGYGAVEYVVGLSTFFAIVVDAGLGPIGVRRVIRDPGSLQLLAFQIPIARLMVAVVGVPVLALIAVSAMGVSAPVGLVWLFALSLLTAPWRQEWLLQATGRMTAAAIAQVIRAVVFALAIWTLVRAPHDLMAVGWAEIASVTAMTVYCIWVQQARIAPMRLSGSFKGFGGLLKEGAGLGLTNLVWATSQYAPLFLVGAMLGGAHVAWLGAASRLITSLATFSSLYHFNLYPSVAGAAADGPEALRRLMSRSFRVTSWAGIGLALAITLFAEPLVQVVFGPKLGPAAPLLQVLAWTLPITLCSGHARWGLIAAGAQTRVLWSQLAGLAVLAVVSPALGRELGSLGIAYGAIAGGLAVWIVSHVFAARHNAQPPPITLAARPLALAGAIVAGEVLLTSAPVWAPVAGLALFAVAGPLLDWRLIPDLMQLGASRRTHLGASKTDPTEQT